MLRLALAAALAATMPAHASTGMNAIKAGVEYCGLRRQGVEHNAAIDRVIAENIRFDRDPVILTTRAGLRVSEDVVVFGYVRKMSCPEAAPR